MIIYSVFKLQLQLEPLGWIGRPCTYSQILLIHASDLGWEINLQVVNKAIYIYRFSYFTWRRTNGREWDHKGDSIQEIF